jgi:ribosomal protein S18 acetylase RimI-like enzyme
VSAQIRDYNPSTDADAVSEFYNRNHYGPARDAGVLTGRQLNLVLAERGVHIFLIAEDRGRVVGTIGYLRVSGRRVTRDDELFAGMFVIDPGYRAGFLAGRLFTTSFGRLLEDGIATLRVEVNPANVKALPLYVRVGFRSAEEHPQPDQDGYIELVSHMPGVVSRLLGELAADVPLTDVFSTFSWRTMAGGRNRTIGHGVTVHDGEVLVEYDFTVRGDAIRVRVRMEDGVPVDTTINGVVIPFSSVDEPVEGPAEGPPLGTRAATRGRRTRREVAVGGYSVEVDADGTVSVRHPSYAGAVYRDALASVEGRPSAWRRPASQAPLITEHRGGWLLAWQVDEVRLQKEISIDGRTVTTVVRGLPSRTLAAEPWSSVRGATIRTVVDESPQYRAPNAPGLWPRDLVDFEAALDAEPRTGVRRILIDEPVSGLELEFEWHDAEFVRVEGQPLGRATSSSSLLRYSLTLGVASPHEGDGVYRHPDGVDRVAAVTSRPAVFARDVAGGAWAAETRGRFEAIVARSANSSNASKTSSELVVVPDRGVVCWTTLGHDVLTSPFPTSRTLGPIDDWVAGLWVSTQSAREDLERGVGWGGSPRVGYSATPPDRGPSWSIDVLDDAVAAIRLTLRGGASPTDPEIVAHLTPKVWGSTVFIPAHPTGWWALDRSERRWSCFARAARIPLAEDRVLVVTAAGVDDELLIRSSADTFLVSLISRAQSAHAESVDAAGGSWQLSVETLEAAR